MNRERATSPERTRLHYAPCRLSLRHYSGPSRTVRLVTPAMHTICMIPGRRRVKGQTSHDEGLVKGSHHEDIEKPLQSLRYPGPSPFVRRGPFPSTVNLTCGRRS